METKLLNRLSFPEGINDLDSTELKILADELRELIINTVSRTGGHLASNLGVVELTIALLKCYNPPFDKIIWDVGHQCYAYKILTNRLKKFGSIRQNQGISGFPKITESVYDCFGTGHSSTSISAAFGFAVSRDLRDQRNNVLAVIGDGSITNGLAYEALNNSGHKASNFNIILNDNEMSISRNVGSMAQYLSDVITGRYYNRIKSDLLGIIKGFSEKGETLYKFLRRVEEGLKGIILPGNLFEAFGFRYIGPIDGHNIQGLVRTFNNLKNLEGPNIIHVITKKGKGYKYAEDKPTDFHSSKPFLIENGEFQKSSSMSFSSAFGKTMKLLGGMFDDIIGISAAMIDGTGFNEFAGKFPNRFFDVGIAEGHAVTFAAGLAADGMRPFVAIYSTFMQRAFDQIIHDVALQSLPVVFCMDRAGIVGDDGPTHHGTFDISFMNMIPNMIIMAPKDEDELRDMLYTAYLAKKPCSIRYPRGGIKGKMKDELPRKIDIGKWEVLSKGTDIAVIATGSMVVEAVKAQQIMGPDISPMVINARFIKPLDTGLLNELISDNIPILTVEEGSMAGGLGSSINNYILQILQKGCHDLALKNLGLPDIFIEHGSRSELLKKFRLDGEGIAKSIRDLIKYDDFLKRQSITMAQ